MIIPPHDADPGADADVIHQTLGVRSESSLIGLFTGPWPYGPTHFIDMDGPRQLPTQELKLLSRAQAIAALQTHRTTPLSIARARIGPGLSTTQYPFSAEVAGLSGGCSGNRHGPPSTGPQPDEKHQPIDLSCRCAGALPCGAAVVV